MKKTLQFIVMEEKVERYINKYDTEQNGRIAVFVCVCVFLALCFTHNTFCKCKMIDRTNKHAVKMHRRNDSF